MLTQIILQNRLTEVEKGEESRSIWKHILLSFRLYLAKSTRDQQRV